MIPSKLTKTKSIQKDTIEQSYFIKVISSKFKGVTRESVKDKRFNRVNDLMAHLKKRFAPSKKYQWYFKSIVSLRIKQAKIVSDYYKHLDDLLSGAKYVIEDRYTQIHYAGTFFFFFSLVRRKNGEIF